MPLQVELFTDQTSTRTSKKYRHLLTELTSHPKQAFLPHPHPQLISSSLLQNTPFYYTVPPPIHAHHLYLHFTQSPESPKPDSPYRHLSAVNDDAARLGPAARRIRDGRTGILAGFASRITVDGNLAAYSWIESFWKIPVSQGLGEVITIQV